MIIIEENFQPDLFCSKCGRVIHAADVTEDTKICPLCDREYEKTEICRVVRVCNSCGEKFQATTEYFENNPNCPFCTTGILQLVPPTSSPSFTIDGIWNGGNVGKKIAEKNRQLKEREAGYSYEQKSIMEKTTQALRNKGVL